MVKLIICSLFLLLFPGISHAFAETPQSGPAEDSAVILMYHRFGNSKYPTTNVTLEQFDAQIAELKKQQYHIVPLDRIITAFRNGTKLPPRSIAISIDDAYLSILDNAWPRLKAAGFPFTLFVATEPVSKNIPGYMSWQQIRALAKDPLVTIGRHSKNHGHLIYMSAEKAAKDIDAATEIYRRELGFVPDIFAWPFGEYSPALEKILKKKNIRAAFGQYSSAASSRRDIYALPRFAFNEKYAKMSRFRLIINARALPVHDILPLSPVIDHNPPQPGFTVDKDVRGLSALACYPSHMTKAADISRIGGNRVEVRFDTPLPQGRSRLNCTMPGPDRRWYWFGMPFFVK